MIYKDYFINSEFEDVWHKLHTYYREPDGVKNLYQTLFYTIRHLPIDVEHAGSQLTIESDFEGMIHIGGTPDPIEWLVGREVVVSKEKMMAYYLLEEHESDTPLVPEVAAHLLYWSTLYDFKTQTRHNEDFQQYLESIERGTVRYSFEDSNEALSRHRKMSYYWKETAAYDSAISWTFILNFLRKRIEFHIGYHRYTDRCVNSKHYVARMELCCQLLDIAAADYYNIDGLYVNCRNASRFVGRIFDNYYLNKIERNDDNNKFLLSKLHRAKAYKILWKFLDHNLTDWWD